jgi:hypothetical protein
LVTLTWTNGVLAGDPPTIDLVEVEADLTRAAKDDPYVARTMGSTITGHGRDLLDAPESALVLIRRVIDRVTEIVPDHLFYS